MLQLINSFRENRGDRVMFPELGTLLSNHPDNGEEQIGFEVDGNMRIEVDVAQFAKDDIVCLPADFFQGINDGEDWDIDDVPEVTECTIIEYVPFHELTGYDLVRALTRASPPSPPPRAHSPTPTVRRR